jgi:hypothetical protein
MIAVFISKDERGNLAVCVTLGADDVFFTVEDTPTAGVALNPANAREVARWLLEAAGQLEGHPGTIPIL